MKLEAATLVLLVVVSGCIFAGAATQPAEDLQSNAENAVASHVDDPDLVEVWGVEPPLEVKEDDKHLILHLNEEPGDGNAPGWGFLFIGEERSSAILTASGIGVLAEYSQDTRHGDEEMTPLEPWSVSSDEAATMLQNNETWPPMANDALVVWRLSMLPVDESEDPTPVWMVHANALESGEKAQALVDANTGEIITIETSQTSYGPSAPSSPPEGQGGGCDVDSDTGQVTPINDLSSTVSVEDAGDLHVSASGFGAGEFVVTLEDQDGERILEWSDTFVGNNGVENTVGVPEGTYEATVSTPAGSFSGDLFLAAQWGDAACPSEVQYGPELASSIEGFLTQTASPYANIPNPAVDQETPLMAP